jgi:hypothetical protein
MKTFAPRAARPVARANADIAQDFMDLAFRMESGRGLPRLTRFEEPVSVALAPGAPATLGADLDRLLARLRGEAGIDIRRAPDGAAAQIRVQVVPRAAMRRAVPEAACFVVPRVQTWRGFLGARRGDRLDWATLDRRDRAAVFLPAGVSPQEMRDCLHEEIAQALGPLNDLYRLPDSIFNDDNIHTVLTGFDMLILRAYYAPEIANGMPPEAVRAALPGLLARLNPAGERLAPARPGPTPRSWIDAIETALGPGTPPRRRLAAADAALTIAAGEGWRDARMGFSLVAFGRLALSVDPAAAVAAFAEAYDLYGRLYGSDDIHAAHVAMQLAAFALSGGRAEVAVDLVDRSIPAVIAAENAALLASLLLVKSEALALLGRAAAARTVRLDSLGWARYGFGTEDAVRTHVVEITALTPRHSRPGAP